MITSRRWSAGYRDSQNERESQRPSTLRGALALQAMAISITTDVEVETASQNRHRKDTKPPSADVADSMDRDIIKYHPTNEAFGQV